MSGVTEEFQLVHKLYDFYVVIHRDGVKFPKTEKHTLGEGIKTRIIALIEMLWEANALPTIEKIRCLDRAQRILYPQT